MITVEFFSGDPPCSSCVELIKLADEFEQKYAGKIQVLKYIGTAGTTRFRELGLECVPAVVINGIIRIEGICPSRKLLENALAETGLWKG